MKTYPSINFYGNTSPDNLVGSDGTQMYNCTKGSFIIGLENNVNIQSSPTQTLIRFFQYNSSDGGIITNTSRIVTLNLKFTLTTTSTTNTRRTNYYDLIISNDLTTDTIYLIKNTSTIFGTGGTGAITTFFNLNLPNCIGYDDTNDCFTFTISPSTNSEILRQVLKGFYIMY
jgi:hypothetical protein